MFAHFPFSWFGVCAFASWQPLLTGIVACVISSRRGEKTYGQIRARYRLILLRLPQVAMEHQVFAVALEASK